MTGLVVELAPDYTRLQQGCRFTCLDVKPCRPTQKLAHRYRAESE